jgi:hypothetical protein
MKTMHRAIALVRTRPESTADDDGRGQLLQTS